MGTAPNTRAAVSQKNKIFSYSVGSNAFTQMGVISEFGHDESRSPEAIRGIGYGDQIAELVPGVTEPMTLTVNKTLLYTMNLFQVFGYKGGIDGIVKSLKHHRWPFDIKQELVFSEIASAADMSGSVSASRASVQPTGEGAYYATSVRALVTIYEGCWMNSYSASYTADAAIVSENSSVTVTDVHDGASSYGEYIDTGLSPAGGTPGHGSSIRFLNGSSQNSTPLVTLG
jgi:hypothetical protein